jgi:ubiquinone/menaquinone biosynthesis C-methylase UbiE
MATGHRLFAAFWSFQTRSEPAAIRKLRDEVAGGARGRTLEIGTGVGTNWKYLPADVEYTGIEPDEYMLSRAQEQAAKQGREIELLPLGVERLPFEDGSFDTVLSTLTFCTVGDPIAGLREIHRVLKPGGELRFGEHVRSKNRVYARIQWLAKPVTRVITGGCEHDRDTLRAIRAGGFEAIDFRSTRISGLPVIVGTARKGPATEAGAAGPDG